MNSSNDTLDESKSKLESSSPSKLLQLYSRLERARTRNSMQMQRTLHVRAAFTALLGCLLYSECIVKKAESLKRL